MSLVEVMTFEDAGSISFVESVLRSESILFRVAGNDHSPGRRPRLLVAENDVEHTRDMLIEIGFEKRVYSKKRLGLQE